MGRLIYWYRRNGNSSRSHRPTRERIAIRIQGQLEHLDVLNVSNMIRIKLGTYATPRVAKDQSDIGFLLQRYPNDVGQTADSIPMSDRQFFVRYPRNRFGTSEMGSFRQILKVPGVDEDEDENEEGDKDERSN